MKKKKLTYSVNIPLELTKVVQAARKHLTDSGYKPGGIIFISDVFTWGIKLIAKELNIDISNGLDIEFTTANTLPHKKVTPGDKLQVKLESNKEFLAEEYRLANILSADPKNPLEEYEREYKPKGLSLQEFVKMKEWDWDTSK